MDYFNNLTHTGTATIVSDVVTGPGAGVPAARILTFKLEVMAGATTAFIFPFAVTPSTITTPNSAWDLEVTLRPVDPQDCPNEELLGTAVLPWQEPFIVIRGSKSISQLVQAGVLPNPVLIDRSVVLIPAAGSTAPPTLTIDVPSFSFIASGSANDFLLSRGATILVENGSTLSINGMDVQGCTALARGIVVESGAILNLTGGTIIRDCHTGVDAAPGAHLTSVGTSFNNNVTGINLDMASVPVGSRRLATLNLSGNTFDGSSLLPPSLAPVGNQGYCGINLNFYEHFNVYGGNTFRNMANGLVAYHSIMNIGNMTFTNILTRGTGPYPHQGFGIHLEGEFWGFAWANINELWTTMTFTNCETGIWGDIYPGKVENTTMNTLFDGISWQTSIDMSLHFRENRITTGRFGIRSFINEPLRGGLGISRNTINITGASTVRTLSGIDMQEGGFVLPNRTGWSVTRNNISMSKGGNGINYRNGAMGRIFANPLITNGDRRFMYSGIRIQDSKNTIISANSIGQSNTLGFGISRGLESSGGTANIFSCNGFDNTNYGMEFRDQADFSGGVGGNCFNCHGAGLFVAGGAHIGEQYHTGNVWDLNDIATCGSGIGGINLGPVLRSKFTVDAFENPTFNPPVVPSSLWFFNEPTPEPTAVCSGCAAPRTTPGPADSDKMLTGLDMATATGQLTGSIFPAEEAWKADYRLARKLVRHPEYISEDPVYAAFYAETSSASAGQLAYVSEARAHLFDLPAAQESILDTLWNRLLTQTAEIRRLDSLKAAGANVDPVLYASWLVQNKNSMESYAQFCATREAAQEAQINTLLTYNASVTTALACDANHKMVNEIALLWLKGGRIRPDSATLTVLQGIAAQCPLEGGDAVYEARSFVYYFIGTDFEDDSICTAAANRFAPPVRTTSSSQNRLSPNPGPGTLQWSGSGVPATARVFDGLGRSSGIFEFQSERLELGHLPAGLYSVQVFDAAGGLLVTQKVILQR